MTPIAAATGVNRVQGESNVTEAQALEVVKFLIELGVDPKAVGRRRARTPSSAPRIADGTRWFSCSPTMAQTSMRSANRVRRRGARHRGRAIASAACSSTQTRRRCSSSSARIRHSANRVWRKRDADEEPEDAARGSGCWVLGSGCRFRVHGSGSVRSTHREPRTKHPEPRTRHPEPSTRNRFTRARSRHDVLRLLPQPEIEDGRTSCSTRLMPSTSPTRRRRGRRCC